MIKLAIHGKAKTGKSTLANIFQKQFHDEINKKIFITAFADPLKYFILKLLETDHAAENLFGSSELREELVPNTNKSYRQFCIEISNLICSYEPDIWIRKTFDLIKKNEDLELPSFCGEKIKIYNGVLISDIRFRKEFWACKEKGYKLIKLTRPNNDYSLNVLSETDLDQISDDLFDYHVVNNGTIRELEDKVRYILKTEFHGNY